MAPEITSHNSLPAQLSPLDQLEYALGSGIAIWDKINSCSPSKLGPLLGLTFILEEHIESLLGFCMLQDIKNSSCAIIEWLKSFYQTVKFTVNPSKWGPLLQAIVEDLPSLVQLPSHSNYYDILMDLVYHEEELAPQDTSMKITIGSQHDDSKTLQQTTLPPVVTATFLKI
jgi:hypothetical protein